MSQWKEEQIRREAIAAPDIRDEDIPRIIERAQELQDQAEKEATEHPTAEDITEIARELGIETQWVEQALEESRQPPAAAILTPSEPPTPPVAVLDGKAVLRRTETWLVLSIVSFLWLSLFAAAPAFLAHRARKAVHEGDLELAVSRLHLARVLFFGLTGLFGLTILFALFALGQLAMFY